MKQKIMEGKESLERIFAQLSDEQKEQFKNCKDIDDVMKLANAENVELTDKRDDNVDARALIAEGEI
jgi:hypothetical protein